MSLRRAVMDVAITVCKGEGTPPHPPTAPTQHYPTPTHPPEPPQLVLARSEGCWHNDLIVAAHSVPHL